MFAEFLLEGLPPTINNFYIRTRCNVCRTHEAKLWQNMTIQTLKSVWGNRPACSQPLELDIVFEVNNRRRWDIDNRIKPLQDCLERAGVILNDRQVECLHVRRKYSDRAATIITVKDYIHEEN